MSLKTSLRKITDYKYELPKQEGMKVPAYFFINKKLLAYVEEEAIKQAMNVTTLPGIEKAMLVMSDVHTGYGFPIGGVAAFDYENGIITPGGIGFDINCGVRLLKTPLSVEKVMPKIKELLNVLFKNIPSGLGRGSFLKLNNSQLDEVLAIGSKWAVNNGYGFEDDLKHTESYGSLDIAAPEFVSNKAKDRGRNQLGTLGAGNHFLEVQIVEQIFNEKVANAFGLEKNNVVVMIHTGSRGLGHQVCSDYLRLMYDQLQSIREKLVDKELIYAPITHELAVKYLKAMSAAANFAWTNRQLIAHHVRKSFEKVFGVEKEELKQLYDIAHNIAKIETHEIDGKIKKLIVHRKGATRAFPPGHEELVEAFRLVGQPVLIPGSMGTSSYVLVGTKKAMSESFGSTCHGAGRVMSRKKALKQFRGEKVKAELEKHNIYVKSGSWKGISEEAPAVYKDVDEVVKVVHQAGIANIVAKLKPLGVIKG